ncbi:MAG: sodium/solute symporter [Planctomycetes bacterium]|nr:sodium/solute symporter [Planctomycetota bacterium]MBL7142594.1 sodium/solute symporter [Phycisphaerae bacterium]
MNYIIAQAGTISGLDWGIVGVGTLGLFVISYVFGREERDTNDFFLGGRSVPPVVACLSFLATEISALTIVGIPHTAYTENWRWLQFLVGLALARVVVAFLFIPAFYKHNCTSIYEFLGHRFGSATQYAGSIYFFITRLIASGVRLYATCMAVGVIMGWPLTATITLFTLVSIAFIAFGGIKAVVWAGAYQALFFVIAGVVVAGYLIQHIDGGLAAAMQIANKEELLSTFYFKFDLKDASTFWAFLISGFFIGLVSFGTDQEMVQRLLTVETRKSSQKTIISTIFTVLPVYWLYLLVGTLLFVFYQQNSSLSLPQELKEILPHFARNVLPNGLKGLVLGAIFMASVDSPLSSLSSSFVTDIYRPLIRRHASEKHYLFVSRAAVVGFGLVLAGIAAACAPVENILWFAFQILSITGGPMLGAFLLGLLTKRKANRANILAMLFSTGVCLVLLILIKQGKLNLAWSWLIVIGTGITFVLAYLFGPAMIKWKNTETPK